VDSTVLNTLLRLTAETEKPASTVPFSQEEYDGRLTKLRAAMAEAGVEVVLLSSPEAMCWLHGYTLRWYKAHSPRRWRPLITTAVHVDHDRFIHFEGMEHAEMLRRTSVATDIRFLPRDKRDDFLEFMVGELAAEGWLGSTVGVELYSYVPSPAVHGEIKDALERHGSTVVDASSITRGVRRVKSLAEIAYIEEAAAINDAALIRLDEVLQPGMTELDAWSEMMSAMTALGGEPGALHETAVVGTMAGHALSGRRKFKAGDMLSVDPCGVVNRYHSNRTGLYYFGEPPEEYTQLMDALGGAYTVLGEVAKAGTPVREVNKAMREYYTETGLWDYRDQTWIGGYELGISFPPDWVGEWTFTIADEEAEGVFEENMVTNFESIVHLTLIDTLVYEKEGARTLSKIPFKIHVIDA